MIRITAILHVVGQFLIVLGGTMLVPLALSVWTGHDLRPLGYSFLITAGCGTVLFVISSRPARELTQREGLLLICCVWFAVCLFGALPFFFSPCFSSFTDAFFESASGFTTTGATVLADVEKLSYDIQFWRCFSHWLGGMGIVLLGVAILPVVGIGGMPLYRTQFSGAKSEKLKPRIIETALALWKIYLALTLAEFLLLVLAGMSAFDAICHTFSTVGTGGFSTRTAGIAAFNSSLIESIIILFMLLAGINFTLHYRLWVEKKPAGFWGDVELRFYLKTFAVTSIVLTAILVWKNDYSISGALRSTVFQVSSIMTTTGFVTDDYAKWLPLPQLTLLMLMFVGGCTGSTAGGLKASRILLLSKVIGREFKRMVHRRGVFAVRLGGGTIPESAIQGLLNLVYLSFLINFFGCLLLAASGLDPLTSIAAVAASMFNIGPGLGKVGPAENYGELTALAKWVLSFCMLAGRLEFYTVLVIFTPAFWRR